MVRDDSETGYQPRIRGSLSPYTVLDTILRIRNSLRSKVAWSGVSAPRPMKIWRWTGSAGLTVSPSTLASTGSVAPAEHDLAVFGDDALDDLYDGLARFRVARHEQGADGVKSGLRQG